MSTINLKTTIAARIDVCFDLARDIDVHVLSTGKTKEKVIAGKTTGLFEPGDTITWEAKHFGITQQLTVEMTDFKRPFYFEDRMLKGTFKSMKHHHSFEEIDGKTIMTDKFEYEVPFGIFGQLFDKFILKNYMMEFILERNTILKSIAESRSSL